MNRSRWRYPLIAVLAVYISSVDLLHAQNSPLKVGDTVTVSAEAAKVMAGTQLLGTIPRGTRFQIEQVNGQWVLGTLTVNSRRANGWVRMSDLSRTTGPAKPPSSTSTPTPPTSGVRDDVANFKTAMETYRRLLPRYDQRHDIPGKLFGTTPIRQGMTATITPQMMNAAYADFTQYYYSAQLGVDPAITRAPETDRLLVSIGAVPTPDEICAKLEARLKALNPSPEVAAAETAIQARRLKIAELRRAGQYSHAAEQAAELSAACLNVYGAAAWQTRDATSLAETLRRISRLSTDVQSQLSTADTTPRTLRTMLSKMQFHSAKDHTLRQYATRKQHLGEQHVETLSLLAWITFLERLHGKEGEEVRHHQLLAAFQARYPKGHPLIACSLSNLGTVRQDRADFEAATKLTIYALQQRLDSLAQEERFDADIVLLLIRLERILEEQGLLRETMRCALLTRAVTRTLPEPIRQAIVRGMFDDVASDEIAEIAEVPFYLTGGLPFRPSFSNLAMYGGSPYLTADQPGGTGSSFDSLSMARTTPVTSPQDEKNFPDIPYMNSTSVYLQKGDYAAAERFARQTVNVARQAYEKRPEFQWRTAAALRALGQLLDLIGNADEAVATFRESVRVQRRVSETEIEKVKSDIAVGKNMTYEPLAQTNVFAELLLTFAEVLQKARNLPEAENVAREAVKVAGIPYALVPTPFNRKLSKEAMARTTLAKILKDAGKFEESETLFRGVLREDFDNWAFSMWTGVRTHEVLSGIVEINAQKGNSFSPEATAMSATAHALVSRNHLFAKHLGASRQWEQYARVLNATGRTAEAIRTLELTVDGVEAARRNVSGDEINRARFFSELTRVDPYSALVHLEIAMQSDDKDSFGDREHGAAAAFNVLEQGRGRALLDLIARGTVNLERELTTLQRRRNDPQLSARIAAIRQQEADAKQNVARLTAELQDISRNPQKRQSLGSTKIAGHLQGLQQQLQEAQQSERRAQQELLDLARASREEQVPKPMNAPQVAAALREGELLLAYDVAAEGTVLLVVHHSGQVDAHVLHWPDGKPILQDVLDASVSEFFEEISREETVRNTAEEGIEIYFADGLRSALLPDAVVEQLRGSSRIFVLADGPLHRLPFETLYRDEDGKSVLLDELPPFVYGPSATVLLSPRAGRDVEIPDKPLQLVALGDPTFNISTERPAAGTGTESSEAAVALLKRSASLQSFGPLSPLPGTRVEIDAIAAEVRKLNGSADSLRILSGSEATVTNLFQTVRSPKLLHLATHGLAEGGRRAWESSLAMAAPAQITANDTGFLRLADLLDRWGGRLQGTDLVVLSACRTARGEFESGDGFVALTWGFLYAGSESVVASLWEVDDMATALLMARFYQNLLGTFPQEREQNGQTFKSGQALPAAIALQEAKLWLRTLPRAEAQAIAEQMLGKETAAIPSRDQPFADPFYWGAFVLFGSNRS